MRTHYIPNKTTSAIIHLLQTLPEEELNVIIKNLMFKIPVKRKEHKTPLKIHQINLKLSDTTFDRDYLYENTR